MSLAALGTLGEGLSIVAAPISIGVSVTIALGFAITTIIRIKYLIARLVSYRIQRRNYFLKQLSPSL
ncbi:hypothetical protein [Chlamydia abortus]|uniref:hypothetical protein n=1 Tax=Chlamydia abortus TaxID=83555 RepID=UPI001117088F|nr:hypothetical protein [Chlamydia abortus]